MQDCTDPRCPGLHGSLLVCPGCFFANIRVCVYVCMCVCVCEASHGCLWVCLSVSLSASRHVTSKIVHDPVPECDSCQVNVPLHK